MFIFALGCASIYLFQPMFEIFTQNLILNTLIVGLGVYGGVLTFSQLGRIQPETNWLNSLTEKETDTSHTHAQPVLLQPLRNLLGDEDANITRASVETTLNNVESKLVSQRELMRYLMGSAIFLGLLGTFWGLSQTLQSVSQVITALPTDAAVANDFLVTLKAGLQGPLGGMGVAFSTSLFGLLASLTLGFFELQLQTARTQFMEYVRQWTHTNCVPIEESLLQKTTESPQLLRALLTMTSDNIEAISRNLTEQQAQQHALTATVDKLSESLSRVVDQRYAEHDVLLKVAENTMALQDSTAEFREAIRTHNFGVDNATAAHIRSLEQSARHLVETTAHSNATLTQELRAEIRLLSRTLASIAGHEEELSGSSGKVQAQKPQKKSA